MPIRDAILPIGSQFYQARQLETSQYSINLPRWL